MPQGTDYYEFETLKQGLLHDLHCLYRAWNGSFIGDDLGRNQRQRVRLEDVAFNRSTVSRLCSDSERKQDTWWARETQ